MFNNLPDKIIFAHRGSSAHAPENTLAAFELAVRQGADAIELDAKLTADGEVVVIHDPNTLRTTGVPGLVRKMTLAQLQELDAGSFFDIAFKGEKIPTLTQVFEAVGKKTYINVELTNYASPMDELPFKVAGLVKKFRLEERVIFSSFMPVALWRIHQLLPGCPIGLLCAPGRSGFLSRSWLGNIVPHQSLNPAIVDTSHRLVRQIHKQNRKIFVYTVLKESEMRQLFAWDVDGIFADDPLLGKKVLQEIQAGA